MFLLKLAISTAALTALGSLLVLAFASALYVVPFALVGGVIWLVVAIRKRRHLKPPVADTYAVDEDDDHDVWGDR